LTVVARSKPSSGKKHKPQRPTAARLDIDGAHARGRETEQARVSRRSIVIAAVVAAATIVSGSLAFQFLTGWQHAFSGGSRADARTSFVSSNTCATCHRGEAELWRSSQHGLAMQHATGKSVLGDFSGASFDYYGVHSRFFRQGGKFFVETDGPDGKLATFEVKYTFGVEPLQQYLIEFPDGRLQALSIAWDSRPKEQDGQRWFHLYPNEEIKHDDVLYWTKLNQNWNFMCAECHSTGVHKNYDAANDRFATSFSEISVGCEACHGQGSHHVAWARARQSWWPFGKDDDPRKGLIVLFDERTDVVWRIDSKTGNAQRNFTPALVRREVETCGLCHARRGEFSEDWVPGRWLSDTHVVSPLTRGLYYADGQMLDEVYNYGSFKQSKMFTAGVTCSDCHEPHGAKLRAPDDGVCLQCHAADKYAAVTHHHHEAKDPPLSCASCHMPEHTYMVVDRRHDHSFRVPRPDLSAKLATPNACNDCHRDKTAEWAASAVERWHGPNRKGFQSYAEAFHEAWTGRSDAAALLGKVAADSSVPAFARASALTELAPHVSPANINLARAGLSDPDPMVRIGALDMLERVPANQLWPLVSPLSPQYGPAAINLADLYRQLGRDGEGESVLRTAIEASPQAAGLHHALGLALTRLKRADEAIAELRRGSELEPERARYAYVYAVALHSAGRGEETIAVLKDGLARHPEDRDILLALITFNRDAGELPAALEFAERLVRIAPNDRDVANLVQSLQDQTRKRSAQ
jgi:predicted CXXCH cytochrome family protein